MYEVVRPQNVYQPAKYLAQTELYKTEVVVLTEDWAEETHAAMDFVVNQEDKQLVLKVQNDGKNSEMVIDAKEDRNSAS